MTASAAFTYDERIISDLHKDARGFRPRDHWWTEWTEATPGMKQEIWDGLIRELEWELEEERARQEAAIEQFEDHVAKAREIMPFATRKEVINMIALQTISAEEFEVYGYEKFEWEQGLPFDYVKKNLA